VNPKIQTIEPSLTIEDLVKVLSVTRRSITNFRQRGLIPEPDFLIGKHPRWRVSTVERVLESLRPTGDEAA
jgi:hypothetical protein